MTKPQRTFTSDRAYIPELLKALNETPPNQRQRRVDIINEFVSKGKDHEKLLKSFMECMWHPHVIFDLPHGIPPFKENTAPDYDTAGRSLYNFFNDRITTYFVKGQKNYIKVDVKRQTLFIQQLESMYKDDAIVLCMMKDKELRNCKKFVNESLFREAMPGYLPPKTEAESPNVQSVNG